MAKCKALTGSAVKGLKLTGHHEIGRRLALTGHHEIGRRLALAGHHEIGRRLALTRHHEIGRRLALTGHHEIGRRLALASHHEIGRRLALTGYHEKISPHPIPCKSSAGARLLPLGAGQNGGKEAQGGTSSWVQGLSPWSGA